MPHFLIPPPLHLSKLFILIAGVVFLSAGYFAWNAFGETVVSTTITSNPDLERGLVGHWTFDGPDLDENATDRSGQGNHGKLKGFTATTTAIGRLGQALEFDGVDNWVGVPESSELDIRGSVSIAAWFSNQAPISNGEDRSIVIKQEADNNFLYSFELENHLGYRLQFRPGGGGGINRSDEIPALESGWHHGVAAYDAEADMVHFYVDGEFINSDPDSVGGGYPINSVRPLHIGESLNGERFNGLLDDVRVYDRALSPAEIKRLYELGGGR